MAEVKQSTIIAYLDKSSLALFFNKVKAPIVYAFPTGSVSDLEVRKLDELASGFKNFLDQNLVPSGQVFFILSENVTFEKDVPVKDQTPGKKEAEEFITSVPFEHVGSKEYRGAKGSRIVAANRELYETFLTVLEVQGLNVMAVTPAAMLGEALKKGLTAEAAGNLVSKTDIIRQNSFINQEEFSAEKLQQESDPRKNKKLLGGIVVFGILLAVLGVMMGKMLFADQKKAATPATLPVTAPPPPPTSEVPALESSSTVATASADLSNLTAQVVNSSGTTGLANNVKTQLEAMGVKNVVTGNGTTVNAAKSILLFSPKVTAAARQKIDQEITRSLGELTVEEASSSGFDVVVTITKNAAGSSSAQTTP